MTGLWLLLSLTLKTQSFSVSISLTRRCICSRVCSVQFGSDEFVMVSMCSEKSIHAPLCLSSRAHDFIKMRSGMKARRFPYRCGGGYCCVVVASVVVFVVIDYVVNSGNTCFVFSILFQYAGNCERIYGYFLSLHFSAYVYMMENR